MKIRSGFAALDVMGPDGELFRRHNATDNATKVVVHGSIVGVWSDHDGESREYHLNVDSVEVLGEER